MYVTGWGIYALDRFKPYNTVFKSRSLKVLDKRDTHSVQTDINKHVYMDLPGRFINHSCNANVGIIDNKEGAYDFICINPIEVGEEILWVSTIIVKFLISVVGQIGDIISIIGLWWCRVRQHCNRRMLVWI